MNFDIKQGICGNQTIIVENSDTATQFGSGLAEVYATPAMIALMEKTAFTSVESLLPKGYSSVGIEINVKHFKASLPGATITCESEVINIDGKKLFFEISAHDKTGQIGKAKHTRYIINSDEFMDSIH